MSSSLRNVSAKIFVAIIILCQFAWIAGCTSSKSVTSPTVPPQSRIGSIAYVELAKTTLEKIQSQESRKDATCWTTVRMMENFYTGLPLSERSVLLKIESSKILMYRLWESASLKAENSILQIGDIKRISPKAFNLDLLRLDGILSSNDNLAKNTMLLDYHKVTENWRVMLSLIYDFLTKTGFINMKECRIKPLSQEAAYQLAKLSTVTTVNLLEYAKEFAEGKKHSAVEPDDIKDAYKKLTCKYGLDDESMVSKAAHTFDPEQFIVNDPLSQETLRKTLYDLTKDNITNKINSLKKWNEPAGIGSGYQNEVKAFEKILQIPITITAYKKMRNFLVQYARVIASGISPMRFDTFLYKNEYDKISKMIIDLPLINTSRKAPIDYISVEWAMNTLNNLWPKRTLINGDISLRLVSSALLENASDRKERKVILWAPDTDATRDITVHWDILKEVWQDPESIPLDPFAAEIISESISEYALFLLSEAKANVLKWGFDTINDSSIDAVLHNNYVLVQQQIHNTVWQFPQTDKKMKVLSQYSDQNFIDITDKLSLPEGNYGIYKFLENYRNNANPAHSKVNLPTKDIHWYMGSGIAVGDINNDSLDDIFVSGDGGNRLYKNSGNYTFTDVTHSLGIDDPDYDSRQSLFVDVNNDNLLDLLIVHSIGPSKLFLQQDSGKFEFNPTSGITTKQGAHTAFFMDYDNDGLLDLFLGYYGSSMTMPFPTIDGLNGRKNQLFHNEGGGKFKDVSEESGVDQTFWTLAGGAMDINHDGNIDFFLANDFGSDALYLNNGNGTFKEVGQMLKTDDRGSGMNISFVDLNNDNDMDVYVTVVDMFSKSIGFKLPVRSSPIKLDDRILQTAFYITGNKMYQNQGGTSFKPVEYRHFEPGDLGWCWSANFFDYENDGDEDMYLANGWIEKSSADNQNNNFFIREENYFYKASDKSPEAFPGNSRAVAPVDLTNTGKIDLVVSNFKKRATLLKNNSKQTGYHWIKVKLKGIKSNSKGVGAKVKVISPQNTTIPAKIVTCGIGYLGQESTTLTFGIGKTATISEIVVTWPNGVMQKSEGPFAADTTVRLVER